MSRPTILIGIGSGGLRSIEAAWKLSQEIPATVAAGDRPIIQYIYLETDQSNEPASSDILKSSLIMREQSATIHALKNDAASTTSWLEGQTFPDNVMNGAGGSPVTGRLCLWDISNRNQFIGRLTTALQAITRHTTEKPLVYVVGSLGGGTGSGTFIDIAYLIRDTLSNRVEVQGLFLIPNTGLGDRVIYCNTVCSLKELDYFNDENHKFPFKWGANPPKGYEAENSPYDLVQVMSSSYNDALPPVSYSQLQDEAGIFLYLNALGLYDTRRKSLVDASGNIIISKYTTFGLSAIHYPESDIKYLLGNRKAKGMLLRIIDDNHYYDKDYQQNRSIRESSTLIRNNVEKSFDTKFKAILEQWCNTIEVIDNGQSLSVDMHLKNIAQMLASSNSSNDDKRKYLYSFFKVGGEYYKQLKAHCDSNASDSLISLIIQEVSASLEKCHNINIAIITLNSIEDAISKILKYWDVNGYKKEPRDWDNLLKTLITNEVLPMPFIYSMLIEKEKVYYDRLMYILLYGVAIHIFSDSLNKIKNGISGAPDQSGNKIIVRNTANEIMPSVNQLNEWKQIIKNVIDSNNPAYKSCVKEEQSLWNKLNSNKLGNIEYVYPDHTLEATLASIEVRYLTEYANELSIHDVINSDDLYSYLRSLPSNTEMNKIVTETYLYTQVVNAYVDRIDAGDFSVAAAVGNDANIGKINNIANKGLIPHLPINPTGRNAVFKDHEKIPHVLIGYDGVGGGTLGTIQTHLNNSSVRDFDIKDDDRDKFSHIGLNNWLIFYKEFGQMTDNRPFSIIDDLRDFANYSNEYYQDISDNSTSDQDKEKYHGKRMPYVSYNDCRSQAVKYINDAQILYDNLEYEKAQRSYEYAMYWDMANQVARDKVAAVTILLKNESREKKFDRYITIANKYLKDQNYPIAQYYYTKADSTIANDAYIAAQLSTITAALTQVYSILQQGDTLCDKASTMYDKCMSERKLLDVPICIAKYEEILVEYNKALDRSKYDTDIKKKISNINRRIQSLRTL